MKNKMEGLFLQDIKTYYKAPKINTNCSCPTDKQNRTVE